MKRLRSMWELEQDRPSVLLLYVAALVVGLFFHYL
jgi:hypothetical protein